MNKMKRIYSLLYYVFVAIAYVCMLFLERLISNLLENNETLLFLFYILICMVGPYILAMLMRFSLLRWYVDPFAAAEIPLLMIVFSALNEMYSSGVSFAQGIWYALFDNAVAVGWLTWIGWFVLCLVFTISPARKNGNNIAHKLLRKWLEKKHK